MAFNVVGHYPSINAQDIPRNANIRVVFSNPIIISSVSGTNFAVVDSDTFVSVPGTFTFETDSSGGAKTVIFTPTINMLQNTKYSVFIYGKPNSILDQDNTQLTATYFFEFATGMIILNDPTVSGQYLNLINSYYQTEDHKLGLHFNLNVNSGTINPSGDIYLSTTGGGTGNTIPISIPWTYEILNDTVEITLISGDYSQVEYWTENTNHLKARVAENIFEGYGRYNSFIDYFPVDWYASGVYTDTGYINPEDYPLISGYTKFEIYKTYPKNQEPNLSGIDRIYIYFTGLPASTCKIYDYIVTEDEDVL